MMVRQSFAIRGSGSSYIYGYVNATFREGMTKDEFLKFTANAFGVGYGTGWLQWRSDLLGSH